MSAEVRKGYDRAIGVLERLVPLARLLRGAVLVYAVVTALAVVVIGGLLLWHDSPDVWFTWFGFVVVMAVLAVPPGLLLMFVWMLGEVLELPAKLRALPDVGPAHAAELASLVAEARRRPDAASHERPRSLPRDMWRAARLMLKLYDALPLPGPVLAIFRVPLLIAVGAAFLAAGFEIVAAALGVALSLVLALAG